MINKIIRNFLAKQVAGRSDDGIMITLKDPKKVEMLENIMADLLMRNGIDPRAITSEQQLKNIINQIEAASKQTTSGIRNAESAKVFDLKGKRIKNTDNIMGGEELPPPGSRGGPDDIAAPVQSSEESLKNMIEAENKKGIAKIKQRQKMLDDAIEDASPGFANDIKYDAELVAENLAERMGLVYDDLPTKQRLDIYDKAYTGLSKQRFKKRPVQRESLEDFVDDAGGVDESDPRGIDDFIPDDDPEPLAKGGIARIGLKDGMNRRTFLKLFSGLVALPVIGKVLKPLKVGKTVTKVPIIKTDNVAGKPEWFDQLVNKVILEGDDVTKRFATKDREIVHMKKLDEDTTVRVTEDMDEGAVRVEYESPENVYGDPVQLQYKKPLPDEGDPRPAAEFDVAESGPVGRSRGPDDYEIELDEVGGTSISDLTSDVSKLKEYATGKKPTMKEFIKNKKRKDRAKNISEGGENEMDEVIRRQGEFIQFEDIDPNMASGGLARLRYQMGGDVSYDATDTSVYGSSAITVTPDTVMDQFGNQVQAEMGNNFNKPLIPQVTEQAGNRIPPNNQLNFTPPKTPISMQTPLPGSGGISEIDIPVAGGNKNEMGILPVEPVNQLPGFRDDTPTKMPGGPPPEEIKYNDPLPQDQLMSGFAEWKQKNPDKVSHVGTQAIKYMILPNGEPITFSGGAEASNMARYLESIGQPPMKPGNQTIKPIGNPNAKLEMALASGGIARMLGE